MIATVGERQTVVTEVNSELQRSSSVARLCRGEGAVLTVAPLSADHVVGATATLLGPSHLSVHDSFGSRLDKLCRFSFKRTSFLRAGSPSHKRRRIAFEDKSSTSGGGIGTPPHIEVNLLGVEEQDSHVDEKRPKLQQNSLSVIGHVDEELSPSDHSEGRRHCTEQGGESSPMLPRGSPRKGDIKREEHRIVRPASLPNMHQENLGRSFDKLVHSSSEARETHTTMDVTRPTPVHDVEGAVEPCGSSPCGMVKSNCSCIQDVLEGYLTDKQRESVNLHTEAKEYSWDFRVVASVKSQNRNLTSTDVIGTIAFEKTNEHFATGGIARKIRVYAYSSLVSGISSCDEVDDEDDEEDYPEYYKERRLRKRRNYTTDIDHARCCVHEVCTPAKLSSLQWHQERPNLIACGDYDGVVAEWDLERTCAVSERDENGGQRIWSIDYSKDFPDLISSASDDGTVRLWDSSSEQSVAILNPPISSSICCAEFGPVSSSLIALASADCNVYLYDTRWLSTPLLTLSHHKRAASYVRFLNRHSLVSASIDSSVKLWDISSMSSALGRISSPAATEHRNLPVKSFDSHYNVRNFTGLSVRAEGGLIACGSETNQAFVYDSRRSSPILTHSFDYNHQNPNLLGSWSSDRLDSKGNNVEHPEGDAAANIVSAVCWRTKPNDCTLVAANSDGVLRVLSGTHS
ncbi:hypothetical protein KC19_9G066500 [Ceratodon purpureus]|uniref:Uncharacterized protein n=1 Tax=Ceratodon purpureus TaxID=3225 RepID=A0A8T0GTH4_CERPU|nr:hypothetical protein KC19_9G066500 [Ceratodon purpureus]